MFKCKECGQEFDIKPQYCDCGNDEFEELKEIIEPKEEPEYTELQPKKIIKETYSSIPKERISIFSILFFIFCIICSLFIIFYPTKQDRPEITTNKQTQNNIAKKELPQINKIWNDTPTKVVQEKPNTVEEVKQETSQEPVKKEPQPKIQPKIIQSPQEKIIQPKVQSIPKPVVATSQSSKQTAVKTTAKPVQPQKPVVKTVNKEELIQYKASLRNKIASRINFAGIIGDGTCVITFSVSSSGELQKHKFKKQSENFSLNDAVYNAIMQTQFYNPPPDGYNGEVMQFVVKIYNSNYEVTLY